MTGFAALRAPTGQGELTVSLRSVNHRGFDLHFYGGQEFGIFENEVRSLLKGQISRGHLEVRFALERTAETASVGLSRSILGQYLRTLEETARELAIEYKPDLNLLLRLPGVVEEATVTGGLEPEFLPELLNVLQGCATAFNQHREREGQLLREAMIKDAGEIERMAEQIAALRAEALPHFQKRLREKLSELLTGAAVNESRLLEEAALLAERSDIQEEIVRLSVHLGELKKLLEQGGEVGKRIDFLLQEMNRETNTTLAKSANAGEPGIRITALGLDIKANIERIREQALNLE
jgi:uncharacterized protein (TIGR00255 family)